MADEQDKVIRFLADPATHGGAEVNHLETHGAHVFLAGNEAFKIKRAVRYDYMDFSTLEARERMLKRELDLNRPAAPQIYRDVVPVTREGGRLTLGGDGPPVEWVLRMWRFPDGAELSAVAARGELTDKLAEELGRVVADYHARAPRREGDGADRIDAVVSELEGTFAGMRDALGARRVSAFSEGARAALDRAASLLSRRGRNGRVRRCHGDLHLRNLVLIEGQPVPFDALEFDERLATCDILYDLAFLVMDLQHHGLDRAANIVLNAWLFAQEGAEDDGLAALPLFLAVRAGIRAMVEVQTASVAHHATASDTDARDYLDYALKALEGTPPRLVAVGGLSGTGKSTLARHLAPGVGRVPGAVHLRSDLERKALFSAGPLEHLPDDAYTDAAGRAVYDRLLERAETILGTGQSVLLDATFLSPQERDGAATLARRAGVPFFGLWLEAPQPTLTRRVTARRDDASDADAAVVAKQADRDIGQVDWARLDASGPLDDTVARARARLSGR
ncbi:bifunctional aminoglycoside phosphotransferase/ATP-binding protein [Sediminimonas sp.]|uniref:bifunctional aminoglycoside phosphotransferase/ATP-binding protein n=1 Tax=Sediminimonas sp. TaxID=2823379 RepID=UPI0025E7E86F|nr:bifunctional aminoglycoside phosphotransferase/ATP-binding protein [Sediminimonas sp.]